MVYRGKMLFYQKRYGFFKTLILRLMLGILSTVKLIPWVIASAFPNKRDVAQKELHSNLEVIGLCITLS